MARLNPTPMLRISTPEDGRGLGTLITTSEGIEVPQVAAVDLSIRPDDIVRAVVTLNVGQCDIAAHPLLALETVEEAAHRHGYRLVPIED